MPIYTAVPTTLALSVGANPTWSGAVSAVQTVNAVYAAATPFTVSGFDYVTANTETLLLTGFGFAIPADETITDVTLNLWRMIFDSTLVGPPVPGVRDETFRMLKANVSVGNNMAGAINWPSSVTQASYTGSPATWGTTLTYADANDSGFGVALSVKGVRADTGATHTWAGDFPLYNAPSAYFDMAQIVITTTENTGAKPMKDNGANPRVLEGFCIG